MQSFCIRLTRNGGVAKVCTSGVNLGACRSWTYSNEHPGISCLFSPRLEEKLGKTEAHQGQIYLQAYRKP